MQSHCTDIICNTIRFYLMYKSLYNRNIYLQILTMQNNLIPGTGWITEFKYFQISANNQICVPSDPCLKCVAWLTKRAPNIYWRCLVPELTFSMWVTVEIGDKLKVLDLTVLCMSSCQWGTLVLFTSGTLCIGTKWHGHLAHMPKYG